ncbi:hypothetical protein ACTSMF_003520 [Salmonella enterica subsp. enterica serovar Newport]|uniref:Uncharacterized protein n=1 Tax=Citrobacter enshiensis TaxID=2971264 RepID=A0ABT8Q2R0_9ENTR|nr:hypothetical protein [Citrobacter enshiensis]MDN8601864.1 hypothetical protein [Citrobacter enshiensis]
MFIIIAGVNVLNSDSIRDIAGIAGYAGSVEVLDEITRKIDLLSDDERKRAGVNDADIMKMIDAFLNEGFEISFHK